MTHGRAATTTLTGRLDQRWFLFDANRDPFLTLEGLGRHERSATLTNRPINSANDRNRRRQSRTVSPGTPSRSPARRYPSRPAENSAAPITSTA